MALEQPVQHVDTHHKQWCSTQGFGSDSKLQAEHKATGGVEPWTQQAALAHSGQ